MTDDRRTTPAPNTAAGLTIETLGMEVASELGVDLSTNLSAYGLSAQKIDQYEAQTHSGAQKGR